MNNLRKTKSGNAITRHSTVSQAKIEKQHDQKQHKPARIIVLNWWMQAKSKQLHGEQIIAKKTIKRTMGTMSMDV